MPSRRRLVGDETDLEARPRAPPSPSSGRCRRASRRRRRHPLPRGSGTPSRSRARPHRRSGSGRIPTSAARRAPCGTRRRRRPPRPARGAPRRDRGSGDVRLREQQPHAVDRRRGLPAMSSGCARRDERRLDAALANRLGSHRARLPRHACDRRAPVRPRAHGSDAVDAREDDPVVARQARDGLLERPRPSAGRISMSGTIVTSAPRRSSSIAQTGFASGRVTTIRRP